MPSRVNKPVLASHNSVTQEQAFNSVTQKMQSRVNKPLIVSGNAVASEQAFNSITQWRHELNKPLTASRNDITSEQSFNSVTQCCHARTSNTWSTRGCIKHWKRSLSRNPWVSYMKHLCRQSNTYFSSEHVLCIPRSLDSSRKMFSSEEAKK